MSNIKTISTNERGRVNMDEMMEFIRSLPRVQQGIIHTLLTEEFYTETVGNEMATARWNWMHTKD